MSVGPAPGKPTPPYPRLPQHETNAERDDGVSIPPCPVQVITQPFVRGWFGRVRQMTHVEAERFHLRAAASLAGSPFLSAQAAHAQHLRQAELSWRAEQQRLQNLVPMPRYPEPPAYLKELWKKQRQPRTFAQLWAESVAGRALAPVPRQREAPMPGTYW